MRSARPADGRSVWRASSGISGAGRPRPRVAPERAQRRHPPREHPAEGAGGEDHDRERHAEQGQGDEGRDRQRDQHRVGQRASPDPVHRLHHDRDHRRRQTGEQPDDQVGVTGGQVQDRQPQQREHAGEHEQDAGHEPAEGAVEQPAGVDGELLGLRAGQQHAVVQGVQEPALTDPALLVDQLVLHHRDLAGRTAEGLQRDREPRPGRLPQRDHVAGAGLGLGVRWSAHAGSVPVISPRGCATFAHILLMSTVLVNIVAV